MEYTCQPYTLKLDSCLQSTIANANAIATATQAIKPPMSLICPIFNTKFEGLTKQTQLKINTHMEQLLKHSDDIEQSLIKDGQEKEKLYQEMTKSLEAQFSEKVRKTAL